MTLHPRWSALFLALALTACSDNPEKLIASARDYLAKGDTNSAVIQIKSALQKQPDLSEARYLFGVALLDAGDATGAERELRKALESGYPLDQIAMPLATASISIGKAKEIITEYAALKPATPEAVAVVQAGLANAYLLSGEQAKAEAAIEASLAAKPDNPDARLAKARLLLIAQRYDEGTSLLGELIKIDGVRFDALMLRSDLHSFQGKQDLAVADLEAAAPLRPQQARPNLRIAQILLGEGKIDEADAKLAMARKVAPNNPMIRFAGGLIALKRDKFEQARDAAEQVLRVAPNYLPAALLAGTAQLRLQQYLQAQEHLEKVVNKAPGNVGARVLLARAYLGGGEASRALETLGPALTSDAPNREALSVAGEAALRTGDLKHSSEYLDRAAQLAPKDATARARVGVARLAGGETERGIDDLEAASVLAGSDAGGTGADVALALVHMRRGELDKAKQIADEYVKKHPDRPFSYNLLGGVLEARGDKAGERAAFEKALSLDPGFLPAAINLVRLDTADGNTDAARKRLEAVIQKAPKNADAYLVLARFLAERRAKPEDIRAVLDKGIAANPGTASLKLAEIDILLRVGDKKGALALAQDVVASFPDDASSLSLAARAQAAAGDVQQGIATAQKVVSMKPDSAQPLVALADLQALAKNHRAAEELLVKALAMRPEQVDIRARLMAIKVTQKKTDEAIALARDLQKMQPGQPSGYEIEGDAEFLAKDYPAAIASYSRALELGRRPSQAMRLHRSQITAGRKADADAFAARWLKENPRDTLMRNYLAEQAMAAKDWDEVARLYRSVLEIEPKNPAALNNLAWAAGQLKDPKAMSYVDQALAIAPDSPSILDTKGNLQIDAGQVSDGIATLKRAVSFWPERGELRLSLARGLIKSGDKTAARGEINTVLRSAPTESALRQDAETLLKTL